MSTRKGLVCDIVANACLVLAAALVPLIARLHVQSDMPSGYGALGAGVVISDLFCWYKAIVLIALSCCALVFALIGWRRFGSPSPALPLPLVGALIVLMIVAAWRSPFAGSVFMGAPASYEGLFVHLSYLALGTVASGLVAAPKAMRSLIYGLGASLVITAGFGLPEVLGIHPLMSDWAQVYILGIDASRGAYLSRSAHRFATAMFAHSNHLGTYAVMIGLFFLVFALTAHRRIQQIAYACLALLAFALLIGSYSRTAYIAAAAVVALCLSLWVPRFQDRRALRLAGIVGVSLLTILELMDHFSDGALRRRLASLFSPAVNEPISCHIVADGERLRLSWGGATLLFRPNLEHRMDVTSEDGREVGTSFAGMTLRRGHVYDYSSVDVRRGEASFTIALATPGLRIFSRHALLVPEEPPVTRLPFGPTAVNNRAFIWARTLPLLAAAPWFGRGPGSFALDFPNRDFSGFMTIFGTTDIMVDRPHSFYLQYAHAFGMPALFLLLSLVLYYFYQSVTLLRRATSVDWSWTLAAACFTACLSFALTGLCNDSMIGPSTVFWVLLGVGHAANRQLLKNWPRELVLDLAPRWTPGGQRPPAADYETMRRAKVEPGGLMHAWWCTRSGGLGA